MPEDEPNAASARVPASLLTLMGSTTLAVSLASMVGGGLGTLASVILALFASAFMPALYMLASLGFGSWLQRALTPALERPWALRAGLGLAVMLTVTHLMGVAGLLTSTLAATIPVVLGVSLLLLPTIKARKFALSYNVSWLWLGAVPALGVMLVAACSPPGWLWASEFGGYDTLSYHLQLPKEWLASGRVWPMEHNVYSYLPGYMESAFLHVALLVDPKQAWLNSSEGASLTGAQFLHAWIAVMAALITTSAARIALERSGTPGAGKLAPIAGGFVLATPWSVVTGSMAYNEMAVLALFASSLGAALANGIPPARRGLVVGVLIGVACGCKPTALLFCAPGAGLALLWGRPRAEWARLILGACVGGLLMLLPWLMRNWLACGNPVFPQMTSVFGAAHWSAEQVARYKAAHAFEGGLTDALRLFVLPEARGHHRGILHPQWAVFAPVVLVCAGVALAILLTHRMAALMVLILLAQILAWLTLTHVQSRFLMPLLVPGAIVVALGLSRVPVPRLALTLGFLCVLTQSAATTAIFVSQKTDLGGPNFATLLGPGLFADAPEGATDLELGPIAFLNDRLPEASRVLVVGDAAVLYIRTPFAYATTWDTSELTEVMRANEDDPAAWGPALRERGFTHVSIDTGELDRLSLSGWAEPLLDAGYVLDWLAEHAEPIYKDEQGQRLIYTLP